MMHDMLGSGAGIGAALLERGQDPPAPATKKQATNPAPNPAAAGEPPLRCPRCDSSNTKFCYYNNYNLTQPRHFCKTCRRYWTKGGALRNVPIGGGCRRAKPAVIARAGAARAHAAASVDVGGSPAVTSTSALMAMLRATCVQKPLDIGGGGGGGGELSRLLAMPNGGINVNGAVGFGQFAANGQYPSSLVAPANTMARRSTAAFGAMQQQEMYNNQELLKMNGGVNDGLILNEQLAALPLQGAAQSNGTMAAAPAMMAAANLPWEGLDQMGGCWNNSGPAAVAVPWSMLQFNAASGAFP